MEHVKAFLRSSLRKIYPDHWSFYLGEFALYAFLVLVGTGVYLAFVYDASPEHAFASVDALGRARSGGFLLRQIHHWSALIFVAAIVIHMARIFFTAAYRAPRELNWTIGVLLLMCSSIAGFTGYSLPYDALSGTGLRIADAVMRSVPFAGGPAAALLNGGNYPGPQLLPHLQLVHVWLLPLAIGGLITAHLTLLILQKHTQFVPDAAHVVGRRFWPDYAIRTAAAFFATIAVIAGIASFVEINPIADYGPYHPWLVPNPATPDWYAGWLDGGLRLGPPFELHLAGHAISPLFWPGIVMPGIVFAFIFFWPWIDARLRHDDGPSDVLEPASTSPLRAGIGAALLTAGVVLTLAASDDQQAMALGIDVRHLVTFYRWLLPLGSIGAGLLAAEIARELRARFAERGQEAQRVVALRRNAAGGFDEEEPQPG